MDLTELGDLSARAAAKESNQRRVRTMARFVAGWERASPPVPLTVVGGGLTGANGNRITPPNGVAGLPFPFPRCVGAFHAIAG